MDVTCILSQLQHLAKKALWGNSVYKSALPISVSVKNSDTPVF